MTIEVNDTVLLFPIGNMVGNIVAFKSAEIREGDKVVLCPCETTKGFEYIVASRSADTLCEMIDKVIVVPIGAHKEYPIVLIMATEPKELIFTEPWEHICAEETLKHSELWEICCYDAEEQHIELWET